MSTLRYPTVLFDAGDTLIGPRQSFGTTYANVMATLGVTLPTEAWERGLRTGWREFNETHKPGMDRYGLYPGGESEYWLRFVERAVKATPGAPNDPDLARRALEPLRDAFRDPDVWHVFPDVVPVLEQLCAMGARLGVVSNWDSRLPKVLDACELTKYFETIVVSSLEGIEKPNPEMFLRAVERLCGTPATSLHIGDLPDLDETGARAAGLSSVLVDRFGRLNAHGTIPDLDPVPAIVGAALRG